MPESLVTVAQVQACMDMDGFGYAKTMAIRIAATWSGGCDAHMDIHDGLLRPGGTVAGPVLFGLADAAMWGAAMTVHADGVQSVTSDMTIHFLRRPQGTVLKCRATVIKPGRRLIVCRAELSCDDDPAIVGACQCTYAVPGHPIITTS